MRSLSLRLLLLPLLGLFSLGASCNGAQEAAKGQNDPGAAAKSARIENVPNVDTSALTDGERRMFVDLVNDLLSPCGEPVSVAKCVVEARACNLCVPAARYTARLVAEGFEKSEIQEMFASRYDPKKKFSIDTSEAPVRGAPMAKVTIVEFSDFQCPHCAAAHPVLARVIAEFDGQVNLAFKHFPLDSHEYAAQAARAAWAAQQQGKFWEMSDRIFEEQRRLSDEKVREIAKSIGLDMARFEADFASERARERVEKDRKEGLALNVEGTPSLFINGRAYHGTVNDLPKYLKEELGQ